MKRYPKLLQTDSRGQLVIPKELRDALGISEGTGFWAYAIDKEGIFLKKIDAPALKEQQEIKELKEKAREIDVDNRNVEAAESRYRKRQGPLEEV